MFQEVRGLRKKLGAPEYLDEPRTTLRSHAFGGIKQQLPRYGAALAVGVVCTGLAFPLYPQLNVTNIAMLYLLGTVLVALRYGRGPASFLSFVNMLALDYFFIPPLFSLDIENLSYSFTLAVALIVGLIITGLVASVQSQRARAEANEQRANLLYGLSRELSGAPDAPAMARIAAQHAREIFRTRAAVFLAGDAFLEDSAIAGRVLETGEHQLAEDIYAPIGVGLPKRGVLVLYAPSVRLSEARLQLLEAFAGQVALALERAHASETAHEAQIASERASLRNTLLASISHDLRTPLAAIAGAGSLIALSSTALDGDRLETAWHAVDELIEHSLRGNEAALSHQKIVLQVPDDLPLVLVAATLIAQILNNLLQNAAKYTPAGTRVEIIARLESEQLFITVEDNGPGLPGADPERLFEKFQRGRSEERIPGAGLGLAICRAAARLHGGEIAGGNRPEGGARFELRLPVRTQHPFPREHAQGLAQESAGMPA